MTAPSAPATLATLRRLLLGLLLVGLAGTATDLLLLAHYEDAWQLIPLVLVGIGAIFATRAAPNWPPPPIVVALLRYVLGPLRVHYRFGPGRVIFVIDASQLFARSKILRLTVLEER